MITHNLGSRTATTLLLASILLTFGSQDLIAQKRRTPRRSAARQKATAPKFVAYGNGLINKAAVPGEVYIINEYPHDNIIAVIAGTTTDDYAVISTLPQLGVPSDSYYADNMFSGAECGVYPNANKLTWRVHGISTHTTGPANTPPKRTPMTVRVLIIRIK